jgi:hypothetical protein
MAREIAARAGLKSIGGETVSAAPSLQTFVADLARMKRVESGYAKPPADLPAMHPNSPRITQADIDRAVAELRDKRRAEALAAMTGEQS